MSEPFEVHPYDIGQLKLLLGEKADPTTCNKANVTYFESYFKHLNAKKILVERHYVDRDYLEDYSAYYVRCFKDYDRKCTRLHFFKNEFDKAAFEAILKDQSSQSAQSLNEEYLGFIVVKPLPRTIIGRTCLKTYPEAMGRVYPVTRKYDVNVFGLKLSIERTLAFQEQDSVVAACATSAVWSALHGTAMLFQHSIPSPVEITRAASVGFPGLTRNFPNDGLNAEQMAEAIRSVSLEPVYVKATDEYIFQSTMYAYLRGHIPPLLGVILCDTNNSNEVYGRHAVAVTGFNASGPCKPLGTGFRLKASRIIKIYAHDDQIGPFSKMECDAATLTIEGATRSTLRTTWKDKLGNTGGIKAALDILLIPVYHKIRTPFGAIHDGMVAFDAVIEPFRKLQPLLSERLEWDIYLTTVGEFKSNIREGSFGSPDNRLSLLLAEFPRFIWRATAVCGSNPVLDLLFDATDIEQGQFVLAPFVYNDGLRSWFKETGNVLLAFSGLPSLTRQILEKLKSI